MAVQTTSNPAFSQASIARVQQSAARTGTMTIGNVVTAASVMLLLLCGTAVFGWQAVESNGGAFPGWMMLAMIGEKIGF